MFCILATLAFAPFGSQAPPIDFDKFLPYSTGAKDGDYFIGPPYAPAPELQPREGAPTGTVWRFDFPSKDSKIYPGISKTKPGVVPYNRSVHIYVPAQYKLGTPAPFMITQDSLGDRDLPIILDNLIAEHRIPPICAIMIDSGGGDAQGSERGLEYDTLSGRYADFVEYEVLPKLSKLTGVTFTKDPDGRMTMGGSSGGACAFSMAWYRPQWYHRVVSYSGTFVNQQSPFDPATPHGAWEYHEHLISESRRKPLRIWMEVGEHDLRAGDPEASYHNWPLANIRMAGVLKKKGYHYQFIFAKDAGHVDGRVVSQTLPEALEYVWAGYHASGR